MTRSVFAGVLLAYLLASASAAIPVAVRHAGHNHSEETKATTPAPATTAAAAAAENGSSGSSSAASTGSNDSNCFPAGATVATAAGAVKRMDELVAGDRVHVGRGQFSEIFMFTHKTAGAVAEFVVVDAAASAARLRFTPGHYIYVNGALAAASSVAVGDVIELGDGSLDTVTSVTSAVLKGLYNPQTLHGDIVVDNVRASTYTTAVEPAFAHAILTPMRAAYRALGLSTTLLDEGSHLASALPSGAAVY
jgi:hypothetical protein